MTDTCRSVRCGAAIRWARNVASGKSSPFDAEPAEQGEWTITEDLFGDAIAVRDPGAPMPRYVPHWATCPAADQFRKDRSTT